MLLAHTAYKTESSACPRLLMKTAWLSLLGSLVGFLACHRTLPAAPFENAPVALGVFENNTSEPILEGIFTSLFNETWTRRHVVVIHNAEKAAFVLGGTIDQITEAPRSLNREGRGVAHRVTIGVTYRLASKNNDPPLVWSDTAHADWFARNADLPYDQSERYRAIRQVFLELSDRAARHAIEMIPSARSKG